MAESKPPSLDDLLQRMDRMPGMPHVAIKVNSILDDPDTGAQDLADIILQDPALTAQVLKICNSAEYGFSRRIATISEAIAILGNTVLKRVIWTIISHNVLNRPVQGYALEQGALWENAVTCAEYACYIAGKVGFKDTELVFVSALLRDIGKIAMESFIESQHQALEETARRDKLSFAQAEAELLGVNHSEIGAQLARRWNLPETLIRVIEHHHHPSRVIAGYNKEEAKLICIVHLADVFTMMTGAGVGVDGLMYPLDGKALETLGIKAESDTLEQWYGDLLDLREKISVMTHTLVNQ